MQTNTNNVKIGHGLSYKQLEVRRIKHRFYAEIETDITTRNKKEKTQKTIKKNEKYGPNMGANFTTLVHNLRHIYVLSYNLTKLLVVI